MDRRPLDDLTFVRRTDKSEHRRPPVVCREVTVRGLRATKPPQVPYLRRASFQHCRKDSLVAGLSGNVYSANNYQMTLSKMAPTMPPTMAPLPLSSGLRNYLRSASVVVAGTMLSQGVLNKAI